MGLDPQLKMQLRQLISFAVSTATANIYGEVTVGATATAFCRRESRTRSVERADGTFQATRTPYVVLDADAATPTFETRYWLPGISTATIANARHPKYIECCIDAEGAVEHWELEF